MCYLRQLKPLMLEESQFYNTTHVIIHYLKPDCEVSQPQIDSYAGDPQIILEAQEKIGVESKGIQDLIYLAREALRIGEKTYCGQMLYQLEASDEPFLSLERSTELIVLQPRESDEPGEYRASHLWFYFDGNFELGLKVPILTTITDCYYLSASFVVER